MSKNYWETERIRLRGVEPEDWEVYYQWSMDSELMQNATSLEFPTSRNRAKQRYEEHSKKAPDKDSLLMYIELIETGQVVGGILSHHTDQRNGTFMYGIIIGAEFRHNGYASEAILLLMKYFFEELRYQKCTVNIYGWNEGSVALHEKLGFTKEGQHRRMIFAKDQYWDELYYGMTIEEWRERYA